VLEIPYKHSSEVIKKLERDGGWYFVGLFREHERSPDPRYILTSVLLVIHATNIIVLSRGGVSIY
jgi:hypothetical protein